MPARYIQVDAQRPVAVVESSRGAADRKKLVALNDDGKVDATMLDVPIATTDTLGSVIVGDGLAVTDAGILSVTASYTLVPATTESLGGVIVGDGLAVSEAGDGVLSVAQATTNTLGGVVVGEGLDITSGVLSYFLPIASEAQLGGVRIGEGLAVDSEGRLTYTMPPATDMALGGVRIGDGLTVGDDGRVSITPTLSNPATAIHAATEKTVLVDADEFGIADSAASYALKKTTLADIKTAIPSSDVIGIQVFS